MFSERASAIWIGVLAAALLIHCTHLVCMGGERRWRHFAHVAMLIGMIYMFAATSFGVDWLPAAAWIAVYAVTSAAIGGWILARWRLKRSPGALWLLIFVQQVAMIYMWMPMGDWIPTLSFAFAAYFALEASVWLAKTIGWRAPAGFAADPPLVPPGEPRSVVDDLCLTVMAGSMAYMFVGMQLMMTPPAQSQLVASSMAPKPEPRAASSSPSSGESADEGRTARPASPSSAQKPVTYVIVGGDSLSGLARRFLGASSDWRRIAALNPGLDPRRLPVGREIRLPPETTGARDAR
jgi:LysM repeat protein